MVMTSLEICGKFIAESRKRAMSRQVEIIGSPDKLDSQTDLCVESFLRFVPLRLYGTPGYHGPNSDAQREASGVQYHCLLLWRVVVSNMFASQVGSYRISCDSSWLIPDQIPGRYRVSLSTRARCTHQAEPSTKQQH